jgi:putative ABC transport system permease protein
VFEAIAAVTGGGVTLSGAAGEPVHVEARTVSASYFDVFGLRPILGRTFAPDEELPAKKHVVVIGYRLWVSQFGSDPGVLGKRVRIDGELYTVIGVMPARTAVEVFDPGLWRPGDLGRGGVLTPEGKTSRDTRDLRWAAARLKPGVTIEQARREMRVIGDRLARTYPESNQEWGVAVESWPRPVAPGFDRSLYMLLAAVGIVLLIGCANIANLTLARGAARAREMATRVALGAGRVRLARQLVTEHMVIALVGGACGLLVGYALLLVVTSALPSTGVLRAVPTDTTIAMDAPVWLFALMLSVLSGVLSGVGPAISVTRGSLTRSPRRIRSSLVVAEVALAFVLLATTALLLRSFFALQEQIGAGFDSTNVLTARLPIPPTRFAQPSDLNAYLDRIGESVQSVPGIRDVAFTEGLPTQGTPFGRGFQITDQPLLQPALRPASGFKTVSPAYFRAVGLQVIAGRALTDRDRSGTPRVLVVNETFVRTYLPGVDPIGKRLLMEPYRPQDVWEVVGVVADEGRSWEGKPEAVVYATREQNPSDYLAIVVRGTLDPARLQESIRQAVSAVDRDQALADVQPLDRLKTEFMASDRLRSILLGVFAAVALALAALGLYGVLSFMVAQRRREIGIRAALGATAASLVMMVVRQGMIMTAGGLAVGLLGAFAANRLLTTLVVGSVPSNTTTMAAVAGILIAVALIASYLPARRAAGVDPSVTFRTE